MGQPLALLILAFTLMGGGGSMQQHRAKQRFLHTPAERCLTPARWNLNRQLSLPAAPCSPCC